MPFCTRNFGNAILFQAEPGALSRRWSRSLEARRFSGKALAYCSGGKPSDRILFNRFVLRKPFGFNWS